MAHYFSPDRGPDDPLDLLVACAPGLEDLCAVECVEVLRSSERLTVEPGGIACEGGIEQVVLLNRFVGSALHVLVRLDAFPCHHLRDFDKRVRRLAWDQLLQRGQPVAVKATSKRSKLYHTGALEERVAKVLAEVTGVPESDREDPPEDESIPKIRVRVAANHVTLSLDTSGSPLHRRGFRLQVGKAPLREDFAWAMVRSSGWDPQEEVLLDPFCGSGSIPIHAALFAAGEPPNGVRRFAYERTRWMGASPSRGDGGFEPVSDAFTVLGSDRDEGVVEAARQNAGRATVGEQCSFERSTFSEGFERAFATGKPIRVVTNPPFGLRVSGRARDDLAVLHQSFGELCRGSEQVRGGLILSADVGLTRRSGLALEPALSVRAGGLPVTALRFGKSPR
ncbi:MAG: class I SAM-dependent RNA methyltransferase [Planctomycetota bacterium]